MEGQLVEHLVFFSYIQACCLRSCLLVCLKNCRVANRPPVRNCANILQTGQTYYKTVTSTLAWFAKIGRFANRYPVREPDKSLRTGRPVRQPDGTYILPVIKYLCAYSCSVSLASLNHSLLRPYSFLPHTLQSLFKTLGTSCCYGNAESNA